MDILPYLKPDEKRVYFDYISKRVAAWDDGSHQYLRIARAGPLVKFKQLQGAFPSVDHVIAWANPYEPDTPMKVTYPREASVYRLMLGGVYADIDAHLTSKRLLINSDGSGDVMRNYEIFRYRKEHDVVAEIVIDYSRCHAEACGPLEYKDAIEYILKKSVPFDVWGVRHNQPKFYIVPRSAIPSDRSSRNAWRLRDLENASAENGKYY